MLPCVAHPELVLLGCDRMVHSVCVYGEGGRGWETDGNQKR